MGNAKVEFDKSKVYKIEKMIKNLESELSPFSDMLFQMARTVDQREKDLKGNGRENKGNIYMLQHRTTQKVVKKRFNSHVDSCLNRLIVGLVSICLFLLIAGIGSSIGSQDQDLSIPAKDLTQYSLEDLMNIEITSATKAPQKLSDAAAAIFVIPQEDIRRSGVTSIPEALRMVPGVQAAKIDANKWAITARGFNGRAANKLLVLMDGRTVYTPIYSSVFWNNIDTIIEDIERIEVIRGPGASLWGANAVNGVINIISKPAEKTQGVLASAITGTEEAGTVSLRYGGGLGDKTPFRIYFKGFERDEAADGEGNKTADDWRYLRGGFRLEHKSDNRDIFTLQGDVFDGTCGESVTSPSVFPPYNIKYDRDQTEKGYNLLGRWTQTFSNASEASFQGYYDRAVQGFHLTKAVVDTFDLDLQHRFSFGQLHDFTWGLGYRLYRDDFDTEPALLVMEPSHRNYDIFSAFLQDEISFFEKQLRFTLGSKFEYNEFTHFEVQPTARVLWKLCKLNSLWASVSRAVRTPARGERDATSMLAVIPPPARGQLPVAVTFMGSDYFNSETLMSYEIGSRLQVTPMLILDTAFYYNDYKDLNVNIFGTPVTNALPPSYLILPIHNTNNLKGKTYGFELAADWHPMEWSRIQAAYTFMDIDLEYDEGIRPDLHTDPGYYLSLRGSFDLPWNMEFDFWYRYMDNLGDTIDSYSTLDIRFGWKYNQQIELSIAGQNLFDSHHLEFIPESLGTTATEVERGFYAKLTWRF